MKILHTSDWHLGIRLLGKDREEEQEQALQWLIKIIDEEEIDVLIIAGDIFDTGSPSNAARKQYYNFLKSLLKTNCEHVIIIGGNHDSPSMLNAPKEILSMLNVHVVGCAMQTAEGEIDYDQEVIILKNNKGNEIAVIGAVPFLRDRDIMQAVAGMHFDDKVKAMKEGLKEHYKLIAEKLNNYDDVPGIVTGHLFTGSAKLNEDMDRQEGENDIHIGNQAKIDSDILENNFDYVALGHIHKPQKINNKEHIRYSGSMIQISFSERKDKKVVLIAEFNNNKLEKVKTREVPQGRKLLRFKGSYDEIENKIKAHIQDADKEVWAEFVFTEKCSGISIQNLKDQASEKNIEVLKIRFERLKTEITNSEKAFKGMKLDELSVDDIFKLLCESEGYTKEEITELTKTFKELQSTSKQQN